MTLAETPHITYSTGTEPPHSSGEPVLLISGDFVRTGGMDISNYYLADFLGRQSLPVHIVSHNIDPDLLSPATVTWHRVPRPLASNLIGERLLRRAGRSIFARKEFAKGHSVVNGGNCPLPAANWVHYVHAAARPEAQMGFLRKLKTRIAHRIFLAEEARALRHARLIIANSERTKNDVIRHYGIPSERIHVVYYGCDPVVFHPESNAAKQTLRARLGLPQDKFLILFVGALGDRRKGFDTLFDAWRQMPTGFLESSSLIVVGKGAELPQWKKRAAGINDGKSIHFLGFRRDVPEILRSCDAFVAPARYEAFGLAVLEAICCGLPAIVSRHAGVAELYPDSLNELLLGECESAPALAAILRSVRDRYEHFCDAAQPFGERTRVYTWDHMAQSIYAKLAQT